MKTKYKIIIGLLIVILPTFFFFLRPNQYWNMHDDMQIIRQLEMEKCLKDGQIPCRWTPDLGFGYGYPLFNFYPPLPYFVGEIFRLFGFSFVMTVKLTVIVQIIASALAMYLLGTSLFGPLGGFVSSVFYAYAPYRAVNVFVRGAMNEAWASVFFPLIFYFTRNLILDKKFSWKIFLFLSLSISGLLLSHNPMALTFIPFVAMWAIFWLIKQTDIVKKISTLVLSGLLGLGLTAFYTIPVLLESKYVQIESMFINYYHYSVHFVSFSQLFISNFWGDGPSVWGPNDGMSFMLGYVHWIIPVALILFSIYLLSQKTNQDIAKLTIFLGLMGLFAAFMTHQKSSFIWEIITPIQKIQFPWRFLSHSSFLLAIATGALAIYVKNKRWIVLLILLIMIIINWSHFTPVTFGPITDSQKLSGKAWQNQITSGIYDYLPKTASTAPKSEANPIIDKIDVPSDLYTVSGLKSGTDWTFFDMDLKQDATITLSRLAYPGFEITDFGQEIKTSTEPLLGRITVDLQAGNHQIYVKLHNTPIRTISNIISIMALIYIFYFFTNFAWNKLRSKK